METTIAVQASPRGGAAEKALVRCQGITKSYGAVQALRGADFELRAGEVHALLGQNGAGKSTLIKVLAGAVRKDAGVLHLDGRECDFRTPADSRASGISVVYQELSLVPTMSVSANLSLGHEPHNQFGLVRRRETDAAARALLGRLGVTLDLRKPVERLPFAYRQMTEIAKALNGDVKVLVLDEPTSALSEAESEMLFETIGEITRQGVGVIYITHRLAEVFRIADRVTVIRDGSNVATFATSETDMPSLVSAIVGPGHEALRESELAAVASDSGGAVLSTLDEQTSDDAGAAPAGGGAHEQVLALRGVANDRVRDVDLQLEAGEIVGLAGMVGSGRTEILETVFGLRRIAAGEMLLKGQPVTLRRPADAIARGVALVPEDRHEQGVVLEHSIERNIALPRLPKLRRFGFLRRRAANARARAAIGELSIKATGPDVAVKNLSGGNQQKVVFGKWRDPSPQLLLLDEPTVGVDVGAREEIYGVIRAAARKGSAVLVVSSELAELLLVCSRIVIVAGGRTLTTVRREDIENEEHLHRLVQEADGRFGEGENQTIGADGVREEAVR